MISAVAAVEVAPAIVLETNLVVAFPLVLAVAVAFHAVNGVELGPVLYHFI